MALKSLSCPNCGGSISLTGRKITFCEYCGSKLAKPKRSTKTDKNTPRNSKLYEQVIFELKFYKFTKLHETLYKALREDPTNDDLLLIHGIIRKDASNLARITPSYISDEVIKLCKREFAKWTVSFNYNLNLDELRKVKLTQLKQLKLEKVSLNDNPSTHLYLSYFKIFVNDKQYRERVGKLEEINDYNYDEASEKLNKWKRVFKRRFWISMIFLVFALFYLAFYVNEISIICIIFNLIIAIAIFCSRKQYVPKT